MRYIAVYEDETFLIDGETVSDVLKKIYAYDPGEVDVELAQTALRAFANLQDAIKFFHQISYGELYYLAEESDSPHISNIKVM